MQYSGFVGEQRCSSGALPVCASLGSCTLFPDSASRLVMRLPLSRAGADACAAPANAAGQGIVTYQDSYYQLGLAYAPLARGIDCPQWVIERLLAEAQPPVCCLPPHPR